MKPMLLLTAALGLCPLPFFFMYHGRELIAAAVLYVIAIVSWGVVAGRAQNRKAFVFAYVAVVLCIAVLCTIGPMAIRDILAMTIHDTAWSVAFGSGFGDLAFTFVAATLLYSLVFAPSLLIFSQSQQPK